MRTYGERGARGAPGPSRGRGGAAPERRVVVPLVDEREAGRVYDPSLHRFALVGGLLGAAAMGGLGRAIAAGVLPVAGLGQLAASGIAPATFVGAGVGLALGALVGSVIALHRMPARRTATPRP